LQKFQRSAPPAKVGSHNRRTELYRSLATVVNTDVRFDPTVDMIVTAAMEMRAAIRPYSIAVAPSWFLKSLVNISSM
jgi:hypothetical protein